MSTVLFPKHCLGKRRPSPIHLFNHSFYKLNTCYVPVTGLEAEGEESRSSTNFETLEQPTRKWTMIKQCHETKDRRNHRLGSSRMMAECGPQLERALGGWNLTS